jgi:hypothetical protein
METQDYSALKRCVGDTFDAIDGGDKLRPELINAETAAQTTNCPLSPETPKV